MAFLNWLLEAIASVGANGYSPLRYRGATTPAPWRNPHHRFS
ncbi:MAG: hypothetical protein AAGJ08_00780 [Cyanobacteria bacterium P01_H01_bin.35]